MYLKKNISQRFKHQFNAAFPYLTLDMHDFKKYVRGFSSFKETIYSIQLKQIEK